MRSRAGWTPYDGMKVRGWPVATIVRGQVVMRDDELVGEPVGEAVRFVETLPAG
jgi:dihydroorotase